MAANNAGVPSQQRLLNCSAEGEAEYAIAKKNKETQLADTDKSLTKKLPILSGWTKRD